MFEIVQRITNFSMKAIRCAWGNTTLFVLIRIYEASEITYCSNLYLDNIKLKYMDSHVKWVNLNTTRIIE